MKALMKRSATIFVLATAAVAVAPVTAMSDRAGVKHSAHGHGVKLKVVKQQRHRHSVGHRFRKQDVVIVNNWRSRGLPRPVRNQIYIAHGDDVYLAAAATFVVKALMD